MENIKENNDSYHLGHFLMDFFNNGAEDHVWQIDAGTGESELKSSVKSRSVRLARCLRRAGLAPGDVIVVSGRNHLDLHIPFYAAYLNGLPVTGINPFYKCDEIKIHLEITKPKLVFCELSNMENYEKVIKDLELDAKIVTFGDSDKSFAKFLRAYDDNTPEDEFRIATFDTSKVFAWLVSTSGTTGLPKIAAIRHPEIIRSFKLFSRLMRSDKLVPTLSLYNVHWITSYLTSLSIATCNHVKLMTSAEDSVDHVIDIINQYKPRYTLSSPLLLNQIMRQEKQCDLTCFDKVVLGGIQMNCAALQQLKTRMRPDSILWNSYGQTECLGPILMPAPEGPLGNSGTEVPEIKVQLVDPETHEVITEPNRLGEVWAKGPGFTGYYRNPKATEAAFTPDGWIRTGDLMTRDENGFFFFVERISSSIKTHKFWVMPTELELVIQEHPDVVDVCVVGIPHPEYVNQTAAAVQITPGSTVTELELKDLIADKLSDFKHLHGGVLFVDDLPRTASGKIARARVKEMVLEAKKQGL